MGSWASLRHFTTFVNNPSERSERLVLYYSYKIEALLSKLLEFQFPCIIRGHVKASTIFQVGVYFLKMPCISELICKQS